MTEFRSGTVKSLRVRAVEVPMARPLQTSGGSVSVAPLVLIDLESDSGAVGHSYIFSYTTRALAPLARLVENLADLVVGAPLAPLDIEAKLQASFRLLGPQGLTGMALGGIDMAAWDALARARELPLYALLGGTAQTLAAYNSKGLGLIGPTRAGFEAAELVGEGFGAIKVRLGYPSVAEDLDVLGSVRSAVGERVLRMTDYNQGLSLAEAERRLRALEGLDLAWIEEPTRFDDYQGHARLRAAARTPIQLGENAWGPHEMAVAIAAGASDYFMIDVMKIGGVTGWLRGAALAEPAGLPVSSHLFPEVSAHLLAVTPTRHWLEYLDWAEPILAAPGLRLEKGQAQPLETPGNGLSWDEAAVERYRAD